MLIGPLITDIIFLCESLRFSYGMVLALKEFVLVMMILFEKTKGLRGLLAYRVPGQLAVYDTFVFNFKIL